MYYCVEILGIPTEREAYHRSGTDTCNEVGHGVEDFDLRHRCEILAKGHQERYCLPRQFGEKASFVDSSVSSTTTGMSFPIALVTPDRTTAA